jgi:diguanylate cyclase (GGDEF)-like protein
MTRSRAPLTLIANCQEWHSRSIESILGPHGYAVLRAYTAKQVIERAISSHPDIILLDTDLPDRDGLDVCRELSTHPELSRCTPIIMTSPGHPSRQKRLEALRAGAWDFIGSALDGEELPLRLDAYLRAKQEVDRAREESLLDELTGLYNVRGLARRARELGSQAFRQKEPLACIVLTPIDRSSGGAGSMAESPSMLTELGAIIRETGRSSDAVGILGPGEFAIVAQGTDPAGALRLAERLADAASLSFGRTDMDVAIGFDAVQNFHDAPIEPADLLMRASLAMSLSRADSLRDGNRSIRRFETPVH